ncbi:probable E3 ubiquitin-protein ligase HERC2 isoform X1 [Mugil cephalus]|uniref:probable E3 ubiquitin-protein ligase HERC2 isoform X1 n=2 Tax=Mugil cephalus TaxID=48193 RepID=UPI001FB6C853|nr:probable E3 ubiquitin-protein ligase HERC2 isoform X1 [Mugil cephalus]
MESSTLKVAQGTQSDLDMDLLCWGSGELGQTGHRRSGDVGPLESHLKDFTAAGLGAVKLLACGSSHSVVVTVDDKIFAWGNGTNGQLGDGEKTVKDHPVEVALPRELNVHGSHADVDVVNIVGVACGSRHTFIWTETGLAFSFGNNYYAQLGYDFQRADFKEHQLAPCSFQNLPASLKISQVACGERHTLFAFEDGSVAACGQNDYGQIGSGSNENVVVPRFVECVRRVSKVTCGANHNLALTGDGKLFQWGCGRACGNRQRNILLPEEVTLPSSPVRDIAGGCWHSLLLTDGGNVFSWGMGQEGQLGHGDDRMHIPSPRLLSYSQLADVRQIRAGDSYSAAVTAGGELLLWGQIPRVSGVSYHADLKRLWTPQSVVLAGRKVTDVACGTWHIMALTTGSREKNRLCAHPETEAHFRDPVSNPLPTQHTEKENTAQESRPVKHRRLHVPEAPEGSKEQEAEKESESAEEEDRREQNPNNTEGSGVLNDAAFATVRSATGMDGAGNGHSSIKSRDDKEGCRTAGPWELRNRPCRGRGSSLHVVFTTLQLLPRSEGEQCRPSASSLPLLKTKQQPQSRLSAETQEEKSAHLTELGQSFGSTISILQGAALQPKPRPPGIRTGPGTQRVASCHRSRITQHIGLKSPVNKPSPKLSSENQALVSFPGSHTRPPFETSLSSTSSSSEAFGYCPVHRTGLSSSTWNNL